MSKKKLVLLTSKTNYTDYQQLISVCEDLDISIKTFLWEQVTFDNFVPSIMDELNQADMIIMRTSPEKASDLQKRVLTLRSSQEIVRKTLNGETYLQFSHFSKIDQLSFLHAHQVPIPRTYFSMQKEKVQFPIVGKYIYGNGGLQVFLIHNDQELEKVEKEFGMSELLFQEVLPIGEDYRIVVLGDQVVAGHKKVTTTGFVTNVTSGGTVHPVEEHRKEELFSLALQACRLFHCEHAGVDIMYDAQQRPRVLELNRGPGMNKKQYAVWNIDLAREVVSYLQKTRS
jgi:glutathione synthase/RimK-type ligase-like ATP-grasp enzyme